MRWRVPKEHGAWAMLYTPLLLGVAAARQVTWGLAWLFAAATLLFVARESMALWLRARRQQRDAAPLARQMAIQILLGTACGAVLVARWRHFELLFLGAFAGLLFILQFVQLRRREQRSMTAEILAILGLTSTAPAAFCVAHGSFGPAAAWLWMLAAAYFASSVFYVKLRVADLQLRRAAEQRQLRNVAAMYHLALLAALAALAGRGVFSPWVLAGFAPVFVRTAWALVHPSRTVHLRRLGILEIVYSMVFLVCTAGALPRTP